MKILLVLVSIFSIAVCQEYHRVCMSSVETVNLCNEINKSNQIQCIRAKDSTECAMKLQNDDADFTVFHPEQVLVASEFINDKVAVVAEVRATEREINRDNFQMVLVVKKDHFGGLNGLRGKRYCHPGFTDHNLWSPRTLKAFESVLFRDQLGQHCNQKQNISYVEREIKILNDFFGNSCRKGPWTDNKRLNNELEKKYPKLTALCDGNIEKNPLSCLRMQKADVVYTTLSEALKLTNRDDYRLLCKNDTLVTITADTDCSYRNQPWSLVVSRRDKADVLKNNLRLWIDRDYQAKTEGPSPFGGPQGPNTRANLPFGETLALILLRNTKEYRLNILYDSPLPLDYLKRYKQSLDSDIKNQCPMRWCTISEKEQRKCEWLAQASLVAGIEPQVSCIVGEHIYDCLKKIRNKNADIIAIDSNYGYLARKMGHSNILYSENSASDIASIVAVIRDDSSIKTFKDLKGSKACFPEYRGLAWVSFIDAAQRRKLMKKNCEFGKSVSEFFEGICAPGAKDDYHYRQSTEVYDKLCSLCSDNCQSDAYSKFFGNNGALSCLADGTANVAFVEWQAIEKEPNLNAYRILSDDDRVLTIDEYKQNIKTSSLSNTVDSEVIARHNDTRKTDYRHGLLEMDIEFGISFNNEPSFLMFQEFDGEKNLLFKKNVLGLADDESSNDYVKNYVKLFESIDKCTSGSSIVSASTVSFFITSLFVLLGTRYM